MEYRLFAAKPLAKPALNYCPFDTHDQISMNFESQQEISAIKKMDFKDFYRPQFDQFLTNIRL